MGYPSAHLHPYPFWWETHTHTYGYGFVWAQAQAQATLILPVGYPCSSLHQGELAHKVVKWLYGLTNKCHAEWQIATCYQRLECAHLALDRKWLHAHTQQKSMDNKDDQAEGDSDLRYHISPLKNQPVDIFDTIWNNRGDPAYHVCHLTDSNYYDCWLINTQPLKKFLLKLQDHLLGQLMGHEFDGNMHREFTDSDQNSIHFIGTKIYSVQTCCIYYTSYKLQQECDTVNPQTHHCHM